MARPDLTSEEIAALGTKIYQENIRPLMTKADIGKFVLIDVNSGEYEIDERDAEASVRLHRRLPDAFGFGLRVGYSAAYFFGGYDEEPEL